MTDLFTQLLSWKALLVAVGVFGFAPGAALRLILLAFPRSDSRRRELLADLYAVPRWERPLWVAEQLEVAIAEGLAGRVARTWRRLAPERHAAELWRREKDDFLNARYTTAYTFTTVSYTLTVVYVALLVPGTGKLIACVAWAVLGAVMARLHERDKKRLQPGQPLHASGLDRWVFIVAGPTSYAATIYMLVHDLIRLASGNMSHGFWIGTLLCVMILLYPWEAIRSARQAAQPAAGDRRDR